jgi:hypothetical protein
MPVETWILFRKAQGLANRSVLMAKGFSYRERSACMLPVGAGTLRRVVERSMHFLICVNQYNQLFYQR